MFEAWTNATDEEVVAALKAQRTLTQEQVDDNESNHDADSVYSPEEYYTGRY